MLSRVLLKLRSLSFGLVLTTIVLFPLPMVLWQLAEWSVPSLGPSWPLLGVLFGGVDAGAQQPLGRALLRCLGIALILVSLFLPARRDWVRPNWQLAGAAFLALGFFSSLLCPHRFQALREWETWALAGLMSYAVSCQWRSHWSGLMVALVYALTGLTLVHALGIAVIGSVGRMGGIFHHPNALSTFCLMLLAVTFTRAFANGIDRLPAQLASGALVGLVVWSGSLTGGALLVGLAGALAGAGWSWPARVTLGLSAAAVLVAANLLGTGWSLLTLLAMLAFFWAMAVLSSPDRGVLRATWLLTLMMGSLLLLSLRSSPLQSLAASSASRLSSGSGRVMFYQTTLQMMGQNPWLGAGPGGFSRFYPGTQTSVAYYSKFAHSLPLEILAEWGIPAGLALALMLVLVARQATSQSATTSTRCAGWVLLIFALHSTTDVQTQFPYLLMLAAIALGIVGAQGQPGQAMSREGVVTLLTRSLLCLLCLALLILNFGRASAGFDRSLALAIVARAPNAQGQSVADGLLFSSLQSDPLDSEAARLWGLSLLALEQQEAAAGASDLAVALDPHRASCVLLELTARPPRKEDAVARFQSAIALDRVNYPIFYRWLAEALSNEGEVEEALRVLRTQAPAYARSGLARLFPFRENDLDDQLVEFYALKARLEAEVSPSAGEPDLRLALQHCDGRRSRQERLRAYLGSMPPTGLSAKLHLLLDKVPASHAPGSVPGSLD